MPRLWCLGLLLCACNGDDPAESSSAPKRVLLITIDTLRVDAVGGADTPALNEFLKRATRFAGARTPVPLTLPAHLTMLSGEHPLVHGVLDNATPPIPRDRGYELVAEAFAAEGFATAAFLSCAVLGAETGIDAGFQTFECPEYGARWSGDSGDINADERVEAALTWLAATPEDQPWFCWVHFFDPHDPYEPFKGDAKRKGTKEGDTIRELYAGEVRRVDAALERLFAAVPEDALVVIASDHGESLGEHGEPTHGNLCYGTTMDAFMAVSGGSGKVNDEACSVASVAPLLRGESMIPLGVTAGLSLLAYRTHGWAQVLCAFDGQYTLVETGPRLELFDRRADPGETKPIDPSGHPAYERLDRELFSLRAHGNRSSEELLTDSASPYGSVRRPLSNMLPRDRNQKLADPGEGFAFTLELTRAKRLLHMKRFDAAAEALTRLAQRDKASPAPFHFLAFAQSGQGKHGEAAASAREAIRRGYKVAPLLHQLLSEAVASGDRKVLQAALDTSMEERIVPDLWCAEKLVDVCTALGDAAAKERGRDFLERVRRRVTAPKDRKRLDALFAALQ